LKEHLQRMNGTGAPKALMTAKEGWEDIKEDAGKQN
jgi:hypothetical protein